MLTCVVEESNRQNSNIARFLIRRGLPVRIVRNASVARSGEIAIYFVRYELLSEGYKPSIVPPFNYRTVPAWALGTPLGVGFTELSEFRMHDDLLEVIEGYHGWCSQRARNDPWHNSSFARLEANLYKQWLSEATLYARA